MKIVRALVIAAVVLGMASPAWASQWHEVSRTSIPLNYYQGTTHDEGGNHYFTGIYFGLYKTDESLNETARNDDVIPPQVHATEGYDHIGDLSYFDGRLYLPLECYYGPVGNTCKTGAIGIADPDTLQMDYYVKLDPTEIEKVMWCEVSPDGSLLWTQQGDDLLAYRMSDLTQEHAAPAPPIHAAIKLPGAVPPPGITGATFIGDRLFTAGQTDAGGEIWSTDLSTGDATLETTIDFIGESEGIDDDYDLTKTTDGIEGALHYMVQPYNEKPAYPTNGITNGVIYNFDRGAAGKRH
ncbi:MAG TPA: hypothetical protein VFK89_01640 [Actinomycetota bacterium]|nr:hypothetical protein [Actinomycetota bacterium]